MPQRRPTLATSKAILAKLSSPRRLDNFHSIAGRFLHSMRLIAVYERAGRDPVPELAISLGSVEVAARALDLARVVTMIWPEGIRVSRFCCAFLTHDEATIAEVVEAAAQRDRSAAQVATTGLIRPDRIERLWDAAIGLVAAEARTV